MSMLTLWQKISYQMGDINQEVKTFLQNWNFFFCHSVQ